MNLRRLVAAGLPLILLVAACTGAGATPSPTATPPSAAASTTPTEAASPSEAASGSEAASPSEAASGSTVDAKDVGQIGTVLVAGTNGMTVYTFSKDVKDSGTSACTGGCITKWPALTVDAGATPIAGTGVTGKLATITRTDDGKLQVTYNGLPLYFFSGDSAPGDANGVYTGWSAVKP
jgi:predicted lipoprotein with Yx(FWY)xxD motif